MIERRRLNYLAVAAAVILLDVWTKWIVAKNIGLYEAIPIVPNLFQLVHARNTGAAFGLGANTDSRLVPLMLSAGAIAVFGFVVFYAWRAPVTDRLRQIGLHLILGGAIGNLVDRFRFGYVVDFLDVYVRVGEREHHWPAFNVADSAIGIGIALLCAAIRKKPAPPTAEPA